MAALALLVAGCREVPHRGTAVHIEGTVWQPDAQTAHPQGIWERVGAHTLLVQWTALGDVSLMEGCGNAPVGSRRPDWHRIAREPWARDVILGLAGEGDEAVARRDVAALVQRSQCLARLATPLHVKGWYFPVEVDATWQEAPKLSALLASLPRPLWISVYDRGNIGPEALATWLDGWLPLDIGVFFQDGVGVHARTAAVARDYVQVLQQRLGTHRVRLIAEAFRPAVGGGFRPATPEELVPQLQAYGGQRVYLFDGPHYVNETMVEELRERLIPLD